MTDCIRSTHLVLLPGMMCDAALWASQSAALAGEVTIHVGDITAADSIESIAEQVLAQAPPTFALAGLSMGGIVAMEIWRQAPERIERLALLDTNHRADTPERRRIRDRQILDVNNGGLDEVLQDELKPNYLAACHRRNIALLDAVLAMGMTLGAEVFRRQSLALRDRPDSAATLAGITCPTLVLCGDEDQLCTPERHREMAAMISGATLEIIPRCGHLSTMEQAGAVTSALKRWLSNNEE